MKPLSLDDRLSQKFLENHPIMQKAFDRKGIRTYGAVLELTYKQLLFMPGMGYKSVASLQHHLVERGFEGIKDYHEMQRRHRHSLGY